MDKIKKTTLAVLVGLLAIAGNANAAVIDVNADIAASTTWTANNVYRLQQQVYVLPGATLTIEAGTVVASPTNVGGSLAVTRGGKIFVNGTQQNPVIMTSQADVDTWAADASHPTGKNPKSGTWREAANEWGNLTIMGKGLISASHFGNPPQPVGTNTKTPTGLNEKVMEGLTQAFPGDTKVFYGGNDDNDDSGSIHYLSIRYAGKVIGLGNELNGLSLGAIGRETDIDHVEIMNNVDDGIEIWGGTVNIKYASIWNVGDDSFDIDQGWRGKAQFGLVVQGYSVKATQGSGVGDNAIETDGAEDSDAQPVTTAVIRNFTIVGQPISGDHGTAWRDNARIQYGQSVWMDLGEVLVKNDNSDGDGASGYGANGTLSWENTWTTPYTHSHNLAATVNSCGACAPGSFNHPNTLYQTQVSGNLAEIRDSVFFRNNHASAYTEADARGVRTAGTNNVTIAAVEDVAAPIKSITRGAPVVSGSLTMLPVINIDPRANNEATTSVETAPADGFFTPVNYRGAFSSSYNWLADWTAADAFNMTVTTGNAENPEDVDIQLTASSFFQTQNGVVYSVESSTDGGQTWVPFQTIVGDGSIATVTDPNAFDNAKLYRVVVV